MLAGQENEHPRPALGDAETAGGITTQITVPLRSFPSSPVVAGAGGGKKALGVISNSECAPEKLESEPGVPCAQLAEGVVGTGREGEAATPSGRATPTLALSQWRESPGSGKNGIHALIGCSGAGAGPGAGLASERAES